jgi:hypothetical protein
VLSYLSYLYNPVFILEVCPTTVERWLFCLGFNFGHMANKTVRIPMVNGVFFVTLCAYNMVRVG